MKRKCVENEKKSAENGLGYCLTVSQYNEKLYCDTTGLKGVQWAVVSVSQYNHYIVT